MYDETMKDPCKYGLAEHVGEQICVRCGKVFEADDAVSDLQLNGSDTKTEVNSNPPKDTQTSSIDELLEYIAPQLIKGQGIVLKAQITRLITESKIEELNKMPNHTDVNLYVRDRIKELKRGLL